MNLVLELPREDLELLLEDLEELLELLFEDIELLDELDLEDWELLREDFDFLDFLDLGFFLMYFERDLECDFELSELLLDLDLDCLLEDFLCFLEDFLDTLLADELLEPVSLSEFLKSSSSYESACIEL